MAVSTLIAGHDQTPQSIQLLTVEDNEAYLYLIQKAFRSRNRILWDLTVAHDGEQAMKVLFEEERTNAPLPDLILTDWNLPKVSGSELLQRIKKHERLRKIPVLCFLPPRPRQTFTMRMTTMRTAILRSRAALMC